MNKINYEEIKEYIENEGYKLLTPKHEYFGMKTKLKTICLKGHRWEVSAGNFKHGLRCAECKKEKKKELQFKEVKKYIENEEYELLETKYINNYTPMKMRCNKGHISFISWANFKKGRRCSICYKYRKLTYSEVFNYFKKYGFKLLSKEYINAHEKMKVMCPEGHVFLISYAKFYSGRRCPICNSSTGSQEITNILNSFKINFEREKIFKDCKDKRYLPFDFYLPDYNCCIEYDGEQHFEISRTFKLTDKDFKIIKKHDEIKNKYCKNNNIKLIRIPYWEFKNIKDILISNLFIEKPSTTIPSDVEIHQ